MSNSNNNKEKVQELREKSLEARIENNVTQIQLNKINLK